MRICSLLLLLLCLGGCNRGIQTNEAVRQGIVDRLSKVGMNVSALDVTIASVEYHGALADAMVSIAPKGAAAGGMTMKYHLEQQANKWVVVGRQDQGAPHGGGAMPGMANPHGGAAAPGAPGRMPSPEDLPPAGKKR